MQNNRSTAHQRVAFTMLELIVVVVILALLAGLGYLSIRSQLDYAAMNRAIGLLADADRKERRAAMQSPQPGELAILKSKQLLSYRASKSDLQLPGGVQIAEAFVSSPSGRAESINFSQTGQSATYAMHLKNARGGSRWMIVIGASGQVLIRENTNEARTLIALGR